MDFKATSTEQTMARRRSGFSLVELMVAMAVGMLVMGTVASFSMYTAKSFAATANYVDLDSYSRIALDKITRDIRQASSLTACTSNQVSFLQSDGQTLSFTYDSGNKTLTRTVGTSSHVVLQDCESLSFSMYQRNPIGGSYDQYAAATVSTCKLISIQWVCARRVLGQIRNSESVQTAKVVIRKE